MTYLTRFSIPFAVLLVISVTRSSPNANAQNPVIHLVEIRDISSGGAPHLDYLFDGDITSDILSYTVTTISHGVPTTSPATNIIPSQQNPRTLSVPLDFKSFSQNQAESVEIAASVFDRTNQAVTSAPIPPYFLDLSFLAATQNYQSTISALQQTNQSLQTSSSQCSTNLQNASKKLNPNSLTYRGVALRGQRSLFLHLTTDKYSTIQGTESTTNQSPTSTGTDHYLKFFNLVPGTPYSFNVLPLDATTGSAITEKEQTIIESTGAKVNFSPTLSGLRASGPTELLASINFDPNHSLPAGFNSYIKLYYEEQQADGSYGPKVPYGDGGLDANGVPQGTAYTSPYSGPHDFSIPVPNASTRYLVSFAAFDQYGEEIDSGGSGTEISTPAVTPPLAFSAPIAITMNTNTGLTVSWSANRKISNSALKIKFEDGTFLPNIPPRYHGCSELQRNH